MPTEKDYKLKSRVFDLSCLGHLAADQLGMGSHSAGKRKPKNDSAAGSPGIPQDPATLKAKPL